MTHVYMYQVLLTVISTAINQLETNVLLITAYWLGLFVVVDN